MDPPESCGFKWSVADREADLPTKRADHGPHPHHPRQAGDQVGQGLQEDIQLDCRR